MNTLSWFIVAVVAGVIAFVALWDEELNPTAEIWVQAPHRSVLAANNGYFTAMGFFAAVDEDAHAVGRSRVQAYELSRSRNSLAGELSYIDYPQSKRLAVGTELDSLCKVEKRACLSTFSEQADTIQALEHRHQLLLTRYVALRSFESFSTTATSSLHEPMMPVKLLSSLQRLNNATLALEFTNGSRLRAVEELAADIRFQRHWLAESDSVVMKILSTEMLARDLHLFSEFLDSPAFVYRHLPSLDLELTDMTAAERSLSGAIHREFRAMAEIALSTPTSRSFGLDVDLPRWMTRMLYKPNATLNRVWFDFSHFHSLSEQPLDQLKQHWEDELPAKSSLVEYVLNPIGSVLSEVSAPDFRPYIARLSDSAGLLRLIRLKRDIHAGNVDSADVEAFITRHAATLGEPYGGKPMSWNQRTRTIFFDGLAGLNHLSEVEIAPN